MRSATTLGIGHRTLRGFEQHLFELADGGLVELSPLRQESFRLGDQRGISHEGGPRLAGEFGSGIMGRGDIGGREPLGLALDGVKRLVAGVDERKEWIGARLRGNRGGAGKRRTGGDEEKTAGPKEESHGPTMSETVRRDKREVGG